MQIRPIATQASITRMNQKNLKNSLAMTNPQLSFKASEYENEVEREVKSKRDNYTWWQWNLSGVAAWKNYKKEITAWLKKNL